MRQHLSPEWVLLIPQIAVLKLVWGFVEAEVTILTAGYAKIITLEVVMRL